MRRRFAALLLIVLPAAYFLYMAGPLVGARFAFDDMMNMGGYWEKGWKQLFIGQIYFLSSYYRPAGGLFYMPLYDLFGLDPMPYRIGIFALLAANAALAAMAAKLLSRSIVVALITGALTAYHGRMIILYYNTSQLYDVICFFFWFLSLIYYLRIRLRERHLGPRETLVLSVLYSGALNAKEMAVTLPLMLAIFELVWRRRSYDELRRAALPIGVLGVLTVLYIAGHLTGPNAMSKWQGYRPVYTAGRYLDNSGHYLAELFYRDDAFGKPAVIFTWLLLGFLAMRRDRPYLRWAWGLAIFGWAPVAFIPVRSAGCLNIPLFAYSLFAAALLRDAGRWLARERFFRRLPSTAVQGAALSALLAWYAYGLRLELWEYLPMWRDTQKITWAGITELSKYKRDFKPGDRIVFLNDPQRDWELYFTTRLVIRDRSALITLQERHDHILTPDELSTYDHVFRWDDQLRLHRVR